MDITSCNSLADLNSVIKIDIQTGKILSYEITSSTTSWCLTKPFGVRIEDLRHIAIDEAVSRLYRQQCVGRLITRNARVIYGG